MIDSFDFKEPSCAVCGGKEFYNPNLDSPDGVVPVFRILEKADAFFNKNDYESAGKLLEYWKQEAIALKDKKGYLTLNSELIGYYRKIGDKNKALECVDIALSLIDELGLNSSVSGATVYLNCATAYKAFGEPTKAISLYQKTENLYLAHLKMGDEKFGGLYNNMALSYADIKEFDKAIDCYFKAIAVMEKVPNGKPDLAITYVNLAHAYFDMNKVKSAVIDCLFKAYELLNSEGVEHNGYFAYVLSKCAPSFSFFGFSNIEKEFLSLSKDIYERS